MQLAEGMHFERRAMRQEGAAGQAASGYAWPAVCRQGGHY